MSTSLNANRTAAGLIFGESAQLVKHMRLRLLSILVVVLLMFCVFSPPSFAAPTTCTSWAEDTQWRCAKDDAPADKIAITNFSEQPIEYKLGYWLSTCGQNGTNTLTLSENLGSQETKDYDFGGVGPNICHEVFVYDCSTGNCRNTLKVRPT